MKSVAIRAWLGCDPVSETCRTKAGKTFRLETAESFAARRRTRAHHPSTSTWTRTPALSSVSRCCRDETEPPRAPNLYVPGEPGCRTRRARVVDTPNILRTRLPPPAVRARIIRRTQLRQSNEELSSMPPREPNLLRNWREPGFCIWRARIVDAGRRNRCIACSHPPVRRGRIIRQRQL
jgi:hypothetical protein